MLENIVENIVNFVREMPVNDKIYCASILTLGGMAVYESIMDYVLRREDNKKQIEMYKYGSNPAE